MQNTIWELKNSNNEVCSSFEDLDGISKSHFETLFKAENKATSAEVIQISQFFPGQNSEEDKICSRFLWSGRNEHNVLPWVKWDHISKPKYLGGWGLKNLVNFAKALSAKEGLCLLSTRSI